MKRASKRPKVAIEIESCRECHDMAEESYPTADWFEQVTTLYCRKTRRKKNTIGFSEAFEEEPGVPSWCPKRPKVKKAKKI